MNQRGVSPPPRKDKLHSRTQFDEILSEGFQNTERAAREQRERRGPVVDLVSVWSEATRPSEKGAWRRRDRHRLETSEIELENNQVQGGPTSYVRAGRTRDADRRRAEFRRFF